MMQFKRILTRFRRDEDGSVSIELLLVVPVLVWALLSTMVYFDVYRAEAISNRAALTVADMVSREQSSINDDYLEGMEGLMQILAETDTTPSFRLTVFYFDAADNEYYRVWSKRGGDDFDNDLTDATLQAKRGILPIMGDGDRAILLETDMLYRAPFSVGFSVFAGPNLDNHRFKTQTVISPRYINRLCFENSDGTQDCGPT